MPPHIKDSIARTLAAEAADRPRADHPRTSPPVLGRPALGAFTAGHAPDGFRSNPDDGWQGRLLCVPAPRDGRADA
jgi:hypothetical protein